jgi:putative membrane protein
MKGDPVTRTICSLATVAFVAALPLMPLSAATPGDGDDSFLKMAAQGNVAEIALGQLALQNAESAEVKQFGAKIIQDHQQASQEVQQLASKAGIQLPSQISQEQKTRQVELAQLSGHSFDLAYMQYMLKDHRKEVKQFEQTAQHLQHPAVKTWALNTLPILLQHVELASNVATKLGPMTLFSGETAPASK